MQETDRSSDGDTAAAAPPGAPHAISSRADFVAAVQRVVTGAAARGARRLVFVDTDFADWPLDDPAGLAALGAWLLLPGRQLVLLADSFDALPRSRPRFTAWRRDWVHSIEARSPAEPGIRPLPTWALDDGHFGLLLQDKRQWRGRVVAEARELRQAHEQIDAILQRSVPAFPATTVGL
jgi:hypothetical protein